MLFHYWFWHTWKMAYLKEQHVCIILCFILGKNAAGTFEMLVVRANIGRTHFIVVLQGTKMPNTWDVHLWAKQIKMWIEWWAVALQTQKWLSVKLLTFWEFHLDQFRENWKTVWTCTGFFPNLCPTWWVHNKRAFLSECARTFRKVSKETCLPELVKCDTFIFPKFRWY